MKKLILFLILFSSIKLSAQTPDFNLQKYWYLRWRLKNYFMVVGPNYGEGYPSGHRGFYVENLSSGDAPNYLATYMGVLATEIKILKERGMDYNETKRELYYALYALNRWDDCEEQYPWGGFDTEFYANQRYPSNLIGDYIPNPANLNGACLRQDSPHDFVEKHYEQLNKGLLENFTNSNLGDPIPLKNCPECGMYDEGLNKFFYQSDEINEYGWADLDHMIYEVDDDGNIDYDKQKWTNALENIRSFSMLSQDHISSLYMGLALVTRSLDENESYGGLEFQDGESSFVKEARNITQRIRSYMRSTNYNLRLVNGAPISDDWGGNAFWLSYGFGTAAERILDDPSYDSSTSGGEESFKESYRFELGASSGGNSSTAWIVLKLFAVNNDNGRLFDETDTDENQASIYEYSFGNDWQAYYPLIHSYLHNTDCLTTLPKIELDLNLMDCSGHYFYKIEQGEDIEYILPSDWATSAKFHHNSSDNNGGGIWQGQFTGLEYMLMMNLAVLKFPNYIYDYKYNNFSGEIEDEYPHVTLIETIGANPITDLTYNVHPAIVYSNESLILNTIVKNGVKTIHKIDGLFVQPESMDAYLNANVTFRSVKSITVGSFYSDPGTTFEIQNDPYECNSSSTAYEFVINDSPITANQNNNTKAQNKNGNKSLMEEIEVYPNPANDYVNIILHGNSVLCIQIQDILGNVIYSSNNVSQINTIDFRNLTQGLYTVSCVTNDEKIILKIVKK